MQSALSNRPGSDQAIWRPPSPVQDGRFGGPSPQRRGRDRVPLDGSELAEGALNTAAATSQAHGSKIHLVRTVRLRVAGDPATGAASIDLTTQLEEGAASYLAKVRERLVAGGEVVAEVRMGAPATELEEYIGKEGINLVVMTSHGRSGLVRAALGSVTDRLTGNGNAPVPLS